MPFRLTTLFASLLVVATLSGCMSPEGATVGEKQSAAQQMRNDTLSRLYAIHPEARSQVEQSVGYGTFSNVGVYLILLSAGNGWGLVHDNQNGQDTYMKMASGGVGLGLGVKDFRGVFVFTERDALETFLENGWDGSAQADAAAKAESKGGAWAGAVDVAPGIKLYQITENGLALQATLQGTKYWKDEDLN